MIQIYRDDTRQDFFVELKGNMTGDLLTINNFLVNNYVAAGLILGFIVFKTKNVGFTYNMKKTRDANDIFEYFGLWAIGFKSIFKEEGDADVESIAYYAWNKGEDTLNSIFEQAEGTNIYIGDDGLEVIK
jgi:hypothetical protein